MTAIHKKSTTPKRSRAEQALTVAKPLAPEEIRVGDFVVVLHQLVELPSFCWCHDATVLAPDQPVRIQLLPSADERPMKVKSACLPFVIVKLSDGEQRMIDLRRMRLARVDRKFARRLWKGPQPDALTQILRRL